MSSAVARARGKRLTSYTARAVTYNIKAGGGTVKATFVFAAPHSFIYAEGKRFCGNRGSYS